MLTLPSTAAAPYAAAATKNKTRDPTPSATNAANGAATTEANPLVAHAHAK